ncbi:MAG: hypothetical protein JOY96_03270 [Verrucomicrobia bacterium]|nr:hypothetical protein [Verrucomicrobiota bacterium]
MKALSHIQQSKPAFWLEVLELYSHWHSAEKWTLAHYVRQIIYAMRVMALLDLRARDLKAAAISLLCAQDQFWSRL